MRHQTKNHTLGKAQDQRKALLRSLATELFTHGEIKTTMARAKALQPYAENVITMAKKGDWNSSILRSLHCLVGYKDTMLRILYTCMINFEDK